MKKYLDRAIELAFNNIESGGTPYGAVVVYNDDIIGEGYNTLHDSFDVSGHAELIAIKQAQQVLQTNDLSGCTIYASGHPCPMCFGAIGFVGINHIVYANSLEEASDVAMGLSQDIYQYLKGEMSPYQIKIEHRPILIDEENPMKVYGEKINTVD